MKTTYPLHEYLQNFFEQRLINQMGASPETISTYRYAFILLLRYAQEKLRKPPTKILLNEIDDQFVGEFLMHLEVDRGNSPRTRNARLAAIKSFFKFVSIREPQLLNHCHKIISIPQKRFEKKVVGFLNLEELDAIIDATDSNTIVGQRDTVMLKLMMETATRVSEISELKVSNCHFGTVSTITVLGKGNKERTILISKKMANILKIHIENRTSKENDPVFSSYKKTKLSRDAIEQRVNKYTTIASEKCPSITETHVTPHVLRHSKAMSLLKRGQGRTMIKLWLGHASIKSSEPYIHADVSMMEDGLIAVGNEASNGELDRFKADDDLLKFLREL